MTSVNITIHNTFLCSDTEYYPPTWEPYIPPYVPPNGTNVNIDWWWNCPNCGALISGSNMGNFCPYCGWNLTVPVIDKEDEKMKDILERLERLEELIKPNE